jgi:hypothetical protein
MLSSGTSPHHNSHLRGRSPAAKDRVRISPPPPTTSPLRMDPRPLPLLRRRRVLFPLFAFALLCLFLFSPSHDLFGLPPALQGLRRVSPASIAALMRPPVDEIHGLLYYAVHQNEGLAHDAPDPTRQLDISVYADGVRSPTPDWPSRVKHLNAEAPLIVFSKVGLTFQFHSLCLGSPKTTSDCFWVLRLTDVLLVGDVLLCLRGVVFTCVPWELGSQIFEKGKSSLRTLRARPTTQDHRG